jgi:hypothetical protein
MSLLFADNGLFDSSKKYKNRYIPKTNNENMGKLIKQYIDYDRSKNIHQSSYVILPVVIIEGLNVRAELLVNLNGISLFIRSEKVYLYEKERKEFSNSDSIIMRFQILFRKTYMKNLTEDYTLNDYIKVLEHMDHDISRMKLNKIEGVLYTAEIQHPKDVPCVYDNNEIKNMLPCGVCVDECSVCFDETKTVTLCGHSLCILCWNNIKNNGRELPCPICRSNLKNINTKKILEYYFDNDRYDNNHNNDNISSIDMYYVTDSESDETEEDEDGVVVVVDMDEDEMVDDCDYDEFPSAHYNSVVDMY